MLIFPAIDLYQGQAVRLYKGDYDQVTVYSQDPLQVARDFEAAGAEYLHMVDLEGARSGSTANLALIEKIASFGVAVNVHYKPLPLMTAYGKDCSAYPNSYDYYRNLISLPLHTCLSDEDVEFICDTLRAVM